MYSFWWGYIAAAIDGIPNSAALFVVPNDSFNQFSMLIIDYTFPSLQMHNFWGLYFATAVDGILNSAALFVVPN